MPNNIVKSFAGKSGKSVAAVEKLWDKAKDSAEKQGHKDDYSYVVGILKKMLKLEHAIAHDKVELFLGRFQPLHNGHASVIAQMRNPVIALVKGGKTSSDKSKNPLSMNDQKRLIKKVFPKAMVIIVQNGYVPDIGQALRKLGKEMVAVWAGEDRRSDYERQIKGFNKKNPDEAFDLVVKKTFQGGQRIGGTSATLVRDAIRNDDRKLFMAHMPKALHSEWNFLKKKLS